MSLQLMKKNPQKKGGSWEIEEEKMGKNRNIRIKQRGDTDKEGAINGQQLEKGRERVSLMGKSC